MPPLSISKILMPVDFSVRADEAVRYAARLARHFQAELNLLHVLEPAHVDFALVELPDALAALSAARIEKCRVRLASFAAADLDGISVNRLVREGQPAEVILAEAEAVDLVVMPTQGHSRLREFLIGSVTAKVLHDCHRPVLTGIHLAESGLPMDWEVKRLLCAVDSGPEGTRVLQWGSNLAAGLGSEVEVLHVAGEDKGKSKDDLQQSVDAAGLKATVQIKSGEPHEVIVAEARLMNADLIVIGRSSSTGPLGRLRMQGYAIVRKSPCPVLSV